MSQAIILDRKRVAALITAFGEAKKAGGFSDAEFYAAGRIIYTVGIEQGYNTVLTKEELAAAKRENKK